MIRPDGDETDQFKHLLAKARKWRDAIRTNKINRHDAWYCLNNTIMKTLEYPLMATTLTRDQCKQLMSPVLERGLPPLMFKSICPVPLFMDPQQSKE